MKHIQKEWYTCDRCGKEIDNIPSNKIMRKFKRIESFSPVEMMVLTADKTGYISDSKLIMPNICSAEIIEYYNKKRKHIHLCGKCRKEFERFMKME